MLGEMLSAVLSVAHFILKRDMTVVLVALSLVLPLNSCILANFTLFDCCGESHHLCHSLFASFFWFLVYVSWGHAASPDPKLLHPLLGVLLSLSIYFGVIHIQHIVFFFVLSLRHAKLRSFYTLGIMYAFLARLVFIFGLASPSWEDFTLEMAFLSFIVGITSDICFEFISKMDEYAVLASKWKIEAERLENEIHNVSTLSLGEPSSSSDEVFDLEPRDRISESPSMSPVLGLSRKRGSGSKLNGEGLTRAGLEKKLGPSFLTSDRGGPKLKEKTIIRGPRTSPSPPRFIFNPTYNITDPLSEPTPKKWDTPQTGQNRRKSLPFLPQPPLEPPATRVRISTSPILGRKKDGESLTPEPSMSASDVPRLSWGSEAESSSAEAVPKTTGSPFRGARKSKTLSNAGMFRGKKTLPMTRTARIRKNSDGNVIAPQNNTTRRSSSEHSTGSYGNNPNGIADTSTSGKLSRIDYNNGSAEHNEISDSGSDSYPTHHRARSNSCPDFRPHRRQFADRQRTLDRSPLQYPREPPHAAVPHTAGNINLRPTSASLPSTSPSNNPTAEFEFASPHASPDAQGKKQREKQQRQHRREVKLQRNRERRERAIQRQKEEELQILNKLPEAENELCLLLVTHDQSLARHMESIVYGLGLNVVTVHNTEEAMERINKADLVLVDLVIYDAFTLPSVIHQHNYSQPIIGVINNGSDEERALALESGMFDCISRNCSIFTFDALVREVADTGPSLTVARTLQAIDGRIHPRGRRSSKNSSDSSSSEEDSDSSSDEYSMKNESETSYKPYDYDEAREGERKKPEESKKRSSGEDILDQGRHSGYHRKGSNLVPGYPSRSLRTSEGTGHEKGKTRDSQDIGQDTEVQGADIFKLRRHLHHLKKVFNCFVPLGYQRLLAPQGLDTLKLGDTVCKRVTILFSDIRNFATMSESMYISDLMVFLNSYLAFALPPLEKYGGFVDKFIGDSIMGIFAQDDLTEQAVSSVRAGIHMLHNLDYMNSSGFNPSSTGIGINTGRTLIGILGTETRMEPTAIGDSVNLASRTESLCKQYGARLLITEYTLEHLGLKAEDFVIRAVDHVEVKGKSNACRIYEVIDAESEEKKKLKMRLLPHYNKALMLFNEAEFSKAKELFETCLSICSEDLTSKLYVDRCVNLLSLEDKKFDKTTWSGVYKLDFK